MSDTKLKQLIINECSSIPETFELNQLYLTPDTTEEDIANALKQAKEYTDSREQDVRSDFAEADSELQTQITGLSGTVAENKSDITNLKAQKYGADLSYTDDNLQLLDQDGKPIGSAVEIKASGGGSNDLFDHKWADHILNDISWLRADTFSWQSGEVYKSAYDHLVEDLKAEYFYGWENTDENLQRWTKELIPAKRTNTYASNGLEMSFPAANKIIEADGETIRIQPGILYRTPSLDFVKSTLEPQTETIGSNTITYYQAEDGHKIVLPDMEATVQAIYNETGVAWYYILDVANKRFKLPRTKWGFTGIRDGVGNYIAESLPNITGTFNATWEDARGRVTTGAFGATNSGESNESPGSPGSGQCTWDFDASRSSSAYQDSAPVQQRATQMYLYFYVGNYTKSAIEQTAGLNTELFNGKMDRDMSNMNASQTAKETVVGWGMPDFSRGVQKSWNTLYQAETNGFFYIRGDSNASHTIWGIITTDSSETNTITLASSYGNNSSSNFASIFPVPKGYYYKAGDSGVTNTTCIFYPVKGE